MGNSNSQIDNYKSTNEQKNKYKDIEEAIQKAIDTESIKVDDSMKNNLSKQANK